jgi:hypothetical protein
MNKCLLFIFCVLLFVGSKEAFSQRFKPGIIFGGVASDLVGVDPYDNDFHKAGITIGGLLSTKLSDKNSVQFEILYTQKGSLQPPDSLNNYRLYKLSLNYVEVPLMFKHNIEFTVRKKNIDRFYLEAGPSIGRLVKINENNNGIISNDGDFRKTEIALNLGIGCEVLNNLYFNIRFSNSITPVTNQPQQINSFFWYTFNKGHNTLFAFTFRYIFDPENKNNTSKVPNDSSN